MTRSEVRLINVYSVAPENQTKLMEILAEGIHSVMIKQEGYIGSTVLKSLDGKSVAVYARWRAAQDIAAVFQKPENAQYLKRIQELAMPLPGVYEEYVTHNLEDSL